MYDEENIFCTDRLEQPRQDKNLLYRHDKTIEPTKEEPLSFVLLEFPFASVSTVNRSHPSLVSLLLTHPVSHLRHQVLGVTFKYLSPFNYDPVTSALGFHMTLMTVTSTPPRVRVNLPLKSADWRMWLEFPVIFSEVHISQGCSFIAFASFSAFYCFFVLTCFLLTFLLILVLSLFYVTDGNIMYLTDASRFLISCVIQHYAPVVGWGGGGTDA